MDLKLEVQEELWEAIAKNYANESYSSAILDAMHFLTETIRNKTGIEGDGSSLIGQAFGGDNPKIQLNKLQTESEKNIQKGIQEILKGFYTAIRNPRSHDKCIDNKQNTDAIVFFIDYLLKTIEQSKLSFEESEFLKRVFDKYYVKSEEYSNLLISEIPKRQRVNVAISVVRQRTEGDIYNLSYFCDALFEKLEPHELKQVYKVVSEELKYVQGNADIRTILKICPAKHWCEIDKAVRIRIESILKEDVKLGTYDVEFNSYGKNGALGTWVEVDHLRNFADILNWTSMLVEKLKSNNKDEANYVYSWYWSKMCDVNRDNICYPLKWFINDALENNDTEVIHMLEIEIENDELHPWWKVFEEGLKAYPDIKYSDLPF